MTGLLMQSQVSEPGHQMPLAGSGRAAFGDRRVLRWRGC
jgi:hypothetical protein